MALNRRLTSLLATGGLVAAGLAAVASTAGPAAADTFVERWCSDTAPPCVTSATYGGTTLHKGDAVKVLMIGKQVMSDQDYTQFFVTDPGGLSSSTEISVSLNLGSVQPDTTESYAFQPDVDRLGKNPGGQYLYRITGKPVLLTSGCTDTYPNHCTDTATDESMTFDITIVNQKVNLDLIGFDRAQSADTVDGIYLIEGASGDYIESNWDNSRFLTNGTTRARASARFRIPYQMLIDSFKIPAPETMVASSVSGFVNGVPTDFAFSQDPDGGGVFVDIANVTFPPGEGAPRLAFGTAASKPRRILVKRGAITPTRPILERATRTTPHRARITFLRAKPRGAYVNGYQARCQAAGKPTVIVAGKYPTIVVTGLRAGTKYQCSVRAKSRAGYGAWSLRKQV